MAAWLTVRKAVNSSSMILVPLSNGKIPQGYMGIAKYDVIWMVNEKKLDFCSIYFTTILHEINEKDPYKCNNIMEYEHEFYPLIVLFSLFLQKWKKKNGLKKQYVIESEGHNWYVGWWNDSVMLAAGWADQFLIQPGELDADFYGIARL